MKIIFFALIFIFTSCIDKQIKGGKRDGIETNNEKINYTKDGINKGNIEIQLFKNDYGWGYDIIINNEIYIHQQNIPCVSGINGFKSKEKARKTAELVVKKIKNKIIPPTINVKELDSLDVL